MYLTIDDKSIYINHVYLDALIVSGKDSAFTVRFFSPGVTVGSGGGGGGGGDGVVIVSPTNVTNF